MVEHQHVHPPLETLKRADWYCAPGKYYGLTRRVYRLTKANLDLPQPACVQVPRPRGPLGEGVWAPALVGKSDELAKWLHARLLGRTVGDAAIRKVGADSSDVRGDAVGDGGVGAQAEHHVEGVGA